MPRISKTVIGMIHNCRRQVVYRLSSAGLSAATAGRTPRILRAPGGRVDNRHHPHPLRVG
jgi:hypothetical protein